MPFAVVTLLLLVNSVSARLIPVNPCNYCENNIDIFTFGETLFCCIVGSQCCSRQTTKTTTNNSVWDGFPILSNYFIPSIRNLFNGLSTTISDLRGVARQNGSTANTNVYMPFYPLSPATYFISRLRGTTVTVPLGDDDAEEPAVTTVEPKPDLQIPVVQTSEQINNIYLFSVPIVISERPPSPVTDASTTNGTSTLPSLLQSSKSLPNETSSGAADDLLPELSTVESDIDRFLQNIFSLLPNVPSTNPPSPPSAFFNFLGMLSSSRSPLSASTPLAGASLTTTAPVPRPNFQITSNFTNISNVGPVVQLDSSTINGLLTKAPVVTTTKTSGFPNIFRMLFPNSFKY